MATLGTCRGVEEKYRVPLPGESQPKWWENGGGQEPGKLPEKAAPRDSRVRAEGVFAQPKRKPGALHILAYWLRALGPAGSGLEARGVERQGQSAREAGLSSGRQFSTHGSWVKPAMGAC